MQCHMIDGKLSNHDSFLQRIPSMTLIHKRTHMCDFNNSVKKGVESEKLRKREREMEKDGDRKSGKDLGLSGWGEWERKERKRGAQTEHPETKTGVSCFKAEGDTQAFHCSSQLSEANITAEWIQQAKEWVSEKWRAAEQMMKCERGGEGGVRIPGPISPTHQMWTSTGTVHKHKHNFHHNLAEQTKMF